MRSPAGKARVSRRALMGGAALLIATPSISVADALAAAKPPLLVSAFSDDRRTLKATRITATSVGPVTIPGEVLVNTTLLQFLYRKATAMAIYSAPAGHSAPARKIAPNAPEFLFISQGDVTLSTDNGTAHCGVGSVTLLEGATVVEKAGTEGYTAIRVRMSAA